MQKNATPKKQPRERQPAPSGAFTHRIREDGEVFSSEEGRETSSDILPLSPWPGLFVCGRLIAIARPCDTEKGARCQPTTPGRSVGGSEES
ncbi:hypothetical protein BASA81_016667 [Batrachochytrium salamandrivorans]|nr:hypothetical protein BASA81_016667 [Batrachochytrium salamandrivorans]